MLYVIVMFILFEKYYAVSKCHVKLKQTVNVNVVNIVLFKSKFIYHKFKYMFFLIESIVDFVIQLLLISLIKVAKFQLVWIFKLDFSILN